MDFLKELSFVVGKNKVKQIEVIGNRNKSSSLVTKLYNGIIEGKYLSEEDAALDLYQDSPDNINYKKLKYRLQKKLHNSLFFIDVNQAQFNELQKAYYTCYKDYATYKILVGRFARHSANVLAKKILVQTVKYELTDLTVLVLNNLIYHEARIGENLSRYKKYTKKYKYYIKVLKYELKIIEISAALNILFRSSKISKEVLLKKVIKKTNKVQKIFKKHDSFKLKQVGYLILYKRYELVNDYQGLLEICKESYHYFKTKKHFQHKASIISALYRMLTCYTHLKEYEAGEAVAIEAIQELEEGANNWFLFHGYYIILCIHARQIEKAYQLYLAYRSHPKYDKLFQREKEFLIVLEAYIHYLIAKNQIDISTLGKPKKPFRLNKFLNEVPQFSKDKRHSNIPILILQLLFLLHQKDHEAVLDRVNALEMYSSRYLKKGDTFRSNCFIKLLLYLPKSHFHKQAVIRKTKRLRARLNEVPLEMAKQGSETEYIPYEQLWDLILDSLENKFYYV